MITKRIEDYKYGFVSGELFPTEIGNNSNSVAVQKYKKNQIMSFWYRKIDTEYYIIASGRISIEGIIYSDGDIIVYEPYDVRKIIFLEDTCLIVIRTPGTIADYYNYGDATEKELKMFINDYFGSEQKELVDSLKVSSRDITVVVQGAISDYTYRTLESIRTYLPESHVVLSTWIGSNVNNLEYDELVLSEDPGAFSTVYDGKTYYNNLNRQLVGIKKGIKDVNSTFILKIRSDSILLGDNIFRCINLFPEREKEYSFFENKVVIGETFNTLSRSLNGVTVHMPFNISDWFFFGYTNDIKKLFDVELQTEEEAVNWKYKYELPYNHYMKVDKIFHWRYDCEQYLIVNSFKKKFDIPYYDISDFNEENLALSKKLILNNFNIVTVPMHQIINLKYIEDTLEGVNCAEGEYRYGYKEMCRDYKLIKK